MYNFDFRYDVAYELLTNDPLEGTVACGFLPKSPEESYMDRGDYSGFLVISGKGKYIGDNGEKYDLGPGDFVQRRPGYNHTTTVEEGEPWLEFYISAGPSLYNTLAGIKMISDSAVLKTELRPATIAKCENLLLDFKRATDKNKKYLMTALQNFLLHINSLVENGEEIAKVPPMVESVCERLNKDFEKKLDIEAMAKDYKVSYESMRKTFRRYVGMAPNRYRLIMRVNEAQRLLLDSDMSLKIMASELGYADQYAFSTQFKKVVGVSPKKFREEQT